MNGFPFLHTVVLRTPPTALESAADFATVLAMLVAVAAVAVSLYIHWDASSPYVVIYLNSDPVKGATSVVVENLGKAPAYDIMVSGFDAESADVQFRPMIKKCFLYKGIPMLVQGQSRRTVLATNRYALSNYEDKSFEVTLAYKKRVPLRGKITVTEEFTLDFYSFAHTVYSDDDLHEIAKAAKRIADRK